jgi:hypothetical protein
MKNPAMPATRPTLATIHPEWQALSDKVRDLSGRRDEIHVELQEIERLVAYHNAIIFNGDRDLPSAVILPPTPPKPLRRTLMEKLGAFAPEPAPKSAPDAEPLLPTVVYRDPYAAQKAALSKELADVEDALAILHPRLAKAHRDGSQKLCASVLPEYRATVARRLAAAMVEMVEAVAEHDRFTRSLAMEGADPVFLRPLDIPSLHKVFGDPRKGADARSWMSWAIEAGHVDPGVVPAWWTEPAPAPIAAPPAPVARRVLPPNIDSFGRGTLILPPRFAGDGDDGTRTLRERLRAHARRTVEIIGSAATVAPAGQ